LSCKQGRKSLAWSSETAADFWVGTFEQAKRGWGAMQNLEFGLTLTILGMGGTMLILYLIGLLMEGINRVFLQREKSEERRG
jgi:hypothetical protein